MHRELTGRSRGVSMRRRLTELRRYLRGWIGYFGLAQQLAEFSNLDGWIRRRVRMCFWKQWRYPRTKIRKMMELGVSRKLAILHGISRKSHWRMSHPCHALRDAQQMARRTRTNFAKANLERACSTSKNRLVRTRMLGGVGAAVSNGRGYPIYRRLFWTLSCSVAVNLIHALLAHSRCSETLGCAQNVF